MRVLLTEHPRVAGFVADGLRGLGHSISIADTVDLLKVGSAREHDVIIMPMVAQGLDGWAMSRELRRSGVTTPILLLTARDEDAQGVLVSGAVGFLSKPFTLSLLQERLAALVPH